MTKIFCENCGQKTSQTKKGEVADFDEIEFTEEQIVSMEYFTFMYQCDACGAASVHTFSPDMGQDELNQVYPAIKNLIGVPEQIQKAYSEAKKVKKISPLAFATLIRRALEYVCLEQEANGKDLDDKLKDLSTRGVIPDTLAKMSHAIRHYGNVGAHADDTNIGYTDAWIMDDFFTAVVEYVYIAPKKLKTAEERIHKKNE